MQDKKKASAPSYQLDGTREDRPVNRAATIIPFQRKARPTAQEQLDMSRFKAGVMVGFLAAAVLFLVLLWAWIIPTMDGAVATAQSAYEMTSVRHA